MMAKGLELGFQCGAGMLGTKTKTEWQPRSCSLASGGIVRCRNADSELGAPQSAVAEAYHSGSEEAEPRH